MVPRPGLSRIEVALVLIMLAICCALFLVMIAKVREAAERMSCQNNLRQLALGVHGAYDTNGRLPPLTAQASDLPRSVGVPSLYWLLIPYLESSVRLYRPDQTPLANYYAHSSVAFPFRGKDGKEHTQFGGDANQVWKTFLDPADVTAHQLRDVPIVGPDGTIGYYAAGSYAPNGLLPWGVRGGPKSLSEWSPNLILFAERPQVCHPATGEPVYNLGGVGFYITHMSAFATVTPADPPGLWPTGQVASDGDPTNPIQIVAKDRPCDPRLPGSPHRGGMQAAMIDGSTRFFTQETDSQVF